MESSWKFKKVGETSAHVERAMKVVDACLAKIRGEAVFWNHRSFETTGIQRSGIYATMSGRDLFNLVAAVQITGEVEDGGYPSVRAVVEYAGREGIHDPSGNVYVEVFRLQQVQINLKGDTTHYIFDGESIPKTVS